MTTKTNQTTEQAAKPEGKAVVSQIKKEIDQKVMDRIAVLRENKQISFPANYSAENAINSAWLELQNMKDSKGKLVLEVCTKESIANFFLDMVSQGLSLVKKQGYAIPYGDKLTFTRSYFGTIAILKRLPGYKDHYADVVRQGEEFVIGSKSGIKYIESHKPTFETLDNDIVGAFCVIEFESGTKTEIMTKKQIQKSWNKSKTQQSVHKEFPDEMAKRTVIARACKQFINTSDDSDIMEVFNRTSELENDIESESNKIVSENANKTVLKPDNIIEGETVDTETGEVNGSDINPGF